MKLSPAEWLALAVVFVCVTVLVAMALHRGPIHWLAACN